MIDISYPYRLEVVFHAESETTRTFLSPAIGVFPVYKEYYSDTGLSDIIEQIIEQRSCIDSEFSYPYKAYIHQAKYYIRDVYSGTVKNILHFT